MERFASLGLTSDHARSRLDNGGGLLRADKYHTKKVCQDRCICISAHDLSEGEFSPLFVGYGIAGNRQRLSHDPEQMVRIPQSCLS
jgi:hypothetical protein